MISEIAGRRILVSEAKSWINTPYHPGADLRGVGVDCGMLLVRVFVDAGLVPAFDPRPYPQDWHLHREDERYLGFVFNHAVEVARAQPGDVVVFRYGRAYAHGGIVTATQPLTLVHAFSPAQSVIEEPLARNPVLAEPSRRPRFFSLWAACSAAAADQV
jgi:cell wall-associated NlpC family hydrolase